MLKKVLKIFIDNYQPLNKIYVHKNQLIENYQNLTNYNAEIKIAPVLKSNAYGHGITQIAQIVDELNPPLICVDSLPEANILRKIGIKSEILVMGAVSTESLSRKLSFHLTVISKDMLRVLVKYNKKAKIHLFIDSGMNREGITLEDLEEVISTIKKEQLELMGLMTHLSIANDKHHPLTKKQIEIFQKAKKIILKAGLSPKWFHIGGSDALEWIPSHIVNMVRIGRLLYGVQSKEIKHINPVLELESTIVQIKQIKKGESVGYNATFSAQKDTTIALLPIGYNDGVDRRLSNKGTVLIDGEACPIIGLISMNMTVIDISNKSFEIGQKVTVFSSQKTAKNSIENSAQKTNTNPSDVLVGLHPSTRREII